MERKNYNLNKFVVTYSTKNIYTPWTVMFYAESFCEAEQEALNLLDNTQTDNTLIVSITREL